MQHHHDAEEEIFFPALERISGVEGLMERNVEQHRAFAQGFEAFYEFAKGCEVKRFEGERVKELIDGFADPLVKHLKEEIDTLRGLKEYDSVKIRDAYKRFEKELMNTDNVSYFPTCVGVRWSC